MTDVSRRQLLTGTLCAAEVGGGEKESIVADGRRSRVGHRDALLRLHEQPGCRGGDRCLWSGGYLLPRPRRLRLDRISAHRPASSGATHRFGVRQRSPVDRTEPLARPAAGPARMRGGDNRLVLGRGRSVSSLRGATGRGARLPPRGSHHGADNHRPWIQRRRPLPGVAHGQPILCHRTPRSHRPTAPPDHRHPARGGRPDHAHRRVEPLQPVPRGLPPQRSRCGFCRRESRRHRPTRRHLAQNLRDRRRPHGERGASVRCGSDGPDEVLRRKQRAAERRTRCQLTWDCSTVPYPSKQHPNDAGYQSIAQAIAAVVPS